MFDEKTQAAFRSAYTNRCPCCGQGRLLRGLLTPESECSVCKTDFTQHMAGDGGPYVVIFVLGHAMVALVVALEAAFSPPMWVHLVLAGALTLGLSLAMLPPVKRFLIAFSIMHEAGEGDRTPSRVATAAASRDAAE